MKTLTAEKVKRLPVGTDVIVVNEETGQTGRLWINQKRTEEDAARNRDAARN